MRSSTATSESSSLSTPSATRSRGGKAADNASKTQDSRKEPLAAAPEGAQRDRSLAIYRMATEKLQGSGSRQATSQRSPQRLSAAQALEIAKKAGIITASGKLSSRYR